MVTSLHTMSERRVLRGRNRIGKIGGGMGGCGGSDRV
jgi:hypothetical protein